MILASVPQQLLAEIPRTEQECDLPHRLERRLQRMILSPIRVHICNGELQLLGSVRSWHEKQLAQEAARLCAPAYRIRNELCVGGPSEHISHAAVCDPQLSTAVVPGSDN